MLLEKYIGIEIYLPSNEKKCKLSINNMHKSRFTNN